jgi:hypothetical protein
MRLTIFSGVAITRSQVAARTSSTNIFSPGLWCCYFVVLLCGETLGLPPFAVQPVFQV